jgi:hypothetical protein
MRRSGSMAPRSRQKRRSRGADSKKRRNERHTDRLDTTHTRLTPIAEVVTQLLLSQDSISSPQLLIFEKQILTERKAGVAHHLTGRRPGGYAPSPNCETAEIWPAGRKSDSAVPAKTAANDTANGHDVETRIHKAVPRPSVDFGLAAMRTAATPNASEIADRDIGSAVLVQIGDQNLHMIAAREGVRGASAPKTW